MSLNINYNALTDGDLRLELESVGYILKWTDDDQLELFQCGGGHPTIHPYWERSTGELFNSVQEAHRYVFDVEAFTK